MTNNPIGVFDSGLGGLTVVKAIQEALPNESVIYLGDTARVPYGNKSPAIIQEFALQIADVLISKGAKIIVVACNTVSALALDKLQETFDVPILGVIEPGVEAAIEATRNKHIGVIGTIATINSGQYEQKLKDSDGSVMVTSQPCPLFVPLVEEGWLDGPITERVTKTYLEPINEADVDTLILGCTHYPLLKPVLQSQIRQEIVLVDSAEVVATRTGAILKTLDLQSGNTEPISLELYVTDLPARFETVARRFLGKTIKEVSTIHLP